MDGRCFSCASKFSIFKKECGCKSCGRSFCAGCLGFSAVLPVSGGGGKQRICKTCYGNISSGVKPANEASKWSPPENYKKRVAALEAKQNPGQEMPKAVGANSRYLGLSPEDRAIAERLERLKQETKPKSVCSTAEIESRIEALRKDTQPPAPSVREMEDRLALLQGRSPLPGTSKPLHQPPDTRTQTQKAGDLLSQLTDEVAIDQRWDPAPRAPEFGAQPINDLSRSDESHNWPGLSNELSAEAMEREKERVLTEAAAELRDENTRQEKMLEIAQRLAVLQGRDPEKVIMDNCKPYDSDEETEDEAVRRILKQVSEEVLLDEASGYNIPPERSSVADNRRGKQSQNEPLPEQRAAAPIPPARRAATQPQQPDSDDEELPWCCICNEDANLRCHDCDDDLYCKRCFREGHDEFDRKEHQTSSYTRPKKKKGR